jgi:sulfate transport system permease protein
MSEGSVWGRWGLRASALTFLVVMIVVPLAAVVDRGLSDGLAGVLEDLHAPAAMDALWLTVWTAMLMTGMNTVMGTLTAYVLVRYRFPGRPVVNAAVDLPFAFPTLVTGVMLVVLYGPQQAVGGWLLSHGIEIMFAPPGIVLALLFVTYPFVVRSVQPVLMELETDQEEAAYTLGASPVHTFFHVLLPAILPAVVTGALLCFARALGEFGSIVIVAGNIPGKSLTAPVHIFGEIEAGNLRAASSMSVVLLGASFLLILLVDWVQQRREQRKVLS